MTLRPINEDDLQAPVDERLDAARRAGSPVAAAALVLATSPATSPATRTQRR